MGYIDGKIRIFDATSHQLLLTLSGHTSRMLALAWSPDGTKLISGSGTPDNTARIWNALTGGQQFMFGNFGIDISAVGWTPDGNRVFAIPSERNGKVWNPTTGQFITDFTTGTSTDVVWSPDNTKVAIGLGSGTIDIEDATSLQTLLCTESCRANTPSPIVQVAWKPDGSQVAAATMRGLVRSWSATSGQKLLELAANDYQGDDILLKQVIAVAFNASGSQLNSLSGDGRLRIWNASTGQVLQTTQISAPVFAAAWSPDRTKLAYGDTDNTTLHIIPAPRVSAVTPTP
jgi:WD40 repeat protein